MLKLGSVPRLLDPRPDVPFFFLDMMLEGLLQLLDLGNPLVGARIEVIDFLDHSFRLTDFLVMMRLPFLEGFVFRPDLLRDRAIERLFFNLLVGLELRLELRPKLVVPIRDVVNYYRGRSLVGRLRCWTGGLWSSR